MAPHARKNRLTLALGLGLGSVVFGAASVASSPQRMASHSAERLFELPLSDLLKMPVYVASKQRETRQISSASVTSYSSRQLRHYGYYSISELAAISPGYGLVRRVNELGLSSRGMTASAFENNRHLLLVDGIPIRHARGARMPVRYELPLFFAKDVEFLRGPASALYGSGAMNGVVNVRPHHHGPGDTGFEARISAGAPRGLSQAMGNAWFGSVLGRTRLSVARFAVNDSKVPIDPSGLPR